jgi:thiol-disulfide isomerase/thioredoxin
MKIRVSIVPALGAGLAIGALLSGCTPPAKAIPATPTALTHQIMTSRAPLAMVHVWATWCAPCVEEFPELLRIHADYATDGLALILISADDPEVPAEVETFLDEQQSPIGSYITTEVNQHFIEMLSPTWSGALPATFFYRNGQLLAEVEGSRTYAQYAEVIEHLLGK